MLEHVLRASQGNVVYANKLVADLADEQMCAQPAPGMNHAAWVLGHLAFVFDSMTAVFDQKPTMTQEWKTLFNLSSKPLPDRAAYPSKEELLAAYEANYQRIVELVRSTNDEMLAREFPNPRLRPLLPTVGVAMVHILTSHQGVHLGQLSAWRRALGLPGV
jgi:uncharacterized damage-inducible protein DinB